MSDLEKETTNELPQVSELDTLKARADMLGISYHPSIGVEKLREKITAKLNDQPDPDTKSRDISNAVHLDTAGETEGQKRKRLKDEATALVRINVSCNNPAKREWAGEIFTTGNILIGTHKKYVPFNTTDGWHVPKVIYEMIKARECQIFVTERAKNGVAIRRGKLIKEFNVEVLPPLTEKELTELARVQAMKSGQDA